MSSWSFLVWLCRGCLSIVIFLLLFIIPGRLRGLRFGLLLLVRIQMLSPTIQDSSCILAFLIQGTEQHIIEAAFSNAIVHIDHVLLANSVHSVLRLNHLARHPIELCKNYSVSCCKGNTLPTSSDTEDSHAHIVICLELIDRLLSCGWWRRTINSNVLCCELLNLCLDCIQHHIVMCEHKKLHTIIHQVLHIICHPSSLRLSSELETAHDVSSWSRMVLHSTII
mmetsp:Transcript_6685/g.14562  ORF Transcript_6685/g.14562 Transcript_6685/m.14562 type:complete len:224 (+) Transcript_6685:343-1014(+)